MLKNHLMVFIWLSAPFVNTTVFLTRFSFFFHGMAFPFEHIEERLSLNPLVYTKKAEILLLRNIR